MRMKPQGDSYALLEMCPSLRLMGVFQLAARPGGVLRDSLVEAIHPKRHSALRSLRKDLHKLHLAGYDVEVEGGGELCRIRVR